MAAPRETTGAYRALGRAMAGLEVRARRRGAAASRGLLTFATVLAVLLLILALFLPTTELSDTAAIVVSVLSLIPLAFVLLLTLATVRVLWRDSPGRPWLVADPQPPTVRMAVASRVWHDTDTVELADFLGQPSAKNTRAKRANEILAHLERTPMLRPLAVTGSRYWKQQVTDGYRRVPKGIVRQALGSALTIAGWIVGVSVRQTLFQQTAVAAWAGLATIIVAGAMIAACIALVDSARPLTRRGKILRQQLAGLREYVLQTQVGARAPLSDPLVPYAVLFATVPQARAIVERLYPYDGPLERDPTLLTTARFLFRVLWCVVFACAVVFFAWVAATSVGTLGYALPMEWPATPVVVISGLCGVAVTAIGALVLVLAIRKSTAVRGGWIRDLGLFVAPALALIGFGLFCWLAARDSAILDEQGIGLLVTGGLGILAMFAIPIALGLVDSDKRKAAGGRD